MKLNKEEFDKLTDHFVKKDGAHPVEILCAAIEMISVQVGRPPKDRAEIRRVDMPWSHWMHLIGFVSAVFADPKEIEAGADRLRTTILK